MIPLKNNSNVDLSDLTNYPDGRVKDNDGSGNGTPVNRSVYGDLHTNISKLMRLYEITPNELPDNETNGYQIIEALKALASKNDYIYPLLTNGTTTLNIDIKLALMKDNEFITCLASSDKTTETLIKGSGTSTFAVTYSGNFKANEYVRVVKTSGGVSIIRLADWNSLEAMANELGYLKAASNTETIAGLISNKAVTPVSFLAAFAEYVIGATSTNFLATSLRNGLYPKEHFAIVNGLGAPIEKNYGTFTGSDFDDDPINTTYAVSGDIVEAKKVANTTNGGIVEIELSNAHSDFTKIQFIYGVKYLGGYENANNMKPLVWTPVSANKIRVYIEFTSFGTRTIEIQIQTNQR